MTLRELYDLLRVRFGRCADPDVWWPIYHGGSTPPEFERAITNVLVQNGSWKPVRAAVDLLHTRNLLTARALSLADEADLAACALPTGMQKLKARRLKALGAFVIDHFQTEQAFCARVTREQLLQLPGIGPETADRTLLYTCLRLEWPVDTYSLRVLAHYEVTSRLPQTPTEKRQAVAAIKDMVAAQLPACVEDWRRLHALLQLEGERLRERGTATVT
jgi:endonuclease-3 related protein